MEKQIGGDAGALDRLGRDRMIVKRGFDLFDHGLELPDVPNASHARGANPRARPDIAKPEAQLK